MLAMSKIVLESRDYDFWTNLAKNKFSMIASIFGPNRKRLHPYYLLLVIDIASIFGPFFDQDCEYIRSPLLSWLQAYLVPVMKIIATICGPALYFENDLKKINPFQIVFKVGSSSTTIVWSWSWSCSVSSFCTKSYWEDKSSVIGDVPPDIKT